MASISRLFVSSDDLHAYVDEMLPPRAAGRVAAAIGRDAAACARAAAYLKQKADLQALYGSTLDEPLPASMTAMIEAARRSSAHRLD